MWIEIAQSGRRRKVQKAGKILKNSGTQSLRGGALT
jgi:hypothetical protein